MKRNVFCAGVTTVFCTLALGGCFLPKEEAKPSILVKGDSARVYEMTEVVRGEIQKTKTLVATYQQVKTENLSFSVDGRGLDGVYVSVGDEVKKGDLLANLLCEEERKQLTELEYSMKTKELQLVHLQEQKELELEQLSGKKATMSSGEYQGKVSQVQEDYKRKEEDIQDALYIEGLQAEQLRRVVSGSELYAGMDGTVTHLEPMGAGFFSRSGRKMITLSAGDECAFECSDGEYGEFFTKGDSYTFATSSGVKYETYFTGVDVATGVLRFELIKKQYGLPLGLRVLYSLVLEQKEDVLYLPKRAVHYTDGKAYVYYTDAEGNRQMKFITVGMDGDSTIEILDGLTEDEEVILR